MLESRGDRISHPFFYRIKCEKDLCPEGEK
jgi:hypothetical protein